MTGSAASGEGVDLCRLYTPGGGHDEMCTGDGALRPAWSYVAQALGRLGREGLEARLQEARRILRDNGVTYNIHGDPAGMARPWRLDLLPMVVDSSEWSVVEQGLTQRAELLDLVLEDLYGEQDLLRRGLLPPALVFGHPGFLHPCHGRRHAARPGLVFYAADLARGPDGALRVLADRAQAPSGAGYALENRMVLSRVLPSIYRDAQVHRLATFFRAVRAAYADLARPGGDHGRVVVLTPGPRNEAYFEHAYLASYLGYTLAQGSDLLVRDGALWLRSLDGLQPVEVVVRRVDDEYCDPLELREDSFLGVPGLLQVVRNGRVAAANAVGSGVLDNPALMGYLPSLCRHLLGEDLRLPGVESWWCGDPGSREHVLANLDRLVVKVSGEAGPRRCLAGPELDPEARRRLAAAIRLAPHRYVGQELVQPATAPVLADGGLTPRPVVLRSFLVAREGSYVTMPGGLARVADAPGTAIIGSQYGGIGKDTWVLASEPGRQETLVVSSAAPLRRHQRGVPSRVADDLYWVGRYAERAEGMVRLLREVVLRVNDEPALAEDAAQAWPWRRLLQALTLATHTAPGFVGEDAEARLAAPRPEIMAFITDPGRPGALIQTLQALQRAAWSVRDALSGDTWRVVNDIDDRLHALGERPPRSVEQTMDALDPLVTALVAFAGLTGENMTHGQGWLFLEIGRRAERALSTLGLLRGSMTVVGEPAGEALLCEWVLSATDSLMSYRRRYLTGPRPDALLDLVLFDERNPRAVGYQLARIQQRVAELPREATARRSAEERLALMALTTLQLAEPDTLLAVAPGAVVRTGLDGLLAELTGRLMELSEVITATYFRHEDQPRPLHPGPGRSP